MPKFDLHKAVVGLLLLAALLLGGCGEADLPTPTPTKTPNTTGAAVQTQPTDTPIPAVIAVPATATPVPPTATPVPANLAPYTGLPVTDPALIERRPIFICVNNDTAGRKAHWGLSQADLVYEYIVDGFYLTRLTAMYHSQEAARVGPVRSARYPNVWMTDSYDGVLACAGGSDAIRYILKHEVNFDYFDADLDDKEYRYYLSIGNDYTSRLQASTTGIDRWLVDTGRARPWKKLHGFEFAKAPPANPQASASNISIYYPKDSAVRWVYDAALGGYTRFQGEVQQMDPASGQPIVAQNVIVISAQQELTDIVEDSLGTLGVDVKLWGFGDLRVFRDGQVYEGTWRAGAGDPPRWFGPGEVPIPLHPGQSWIQVLGTLKNVTYQ